MDSLSQLGLDLDYKESKRCRKCRIRKPLSEFNRRITSTRIHSYCRAWLNEHNRGSYNRNGSQTMRRGHLKRTYGLSEFEYQMMFIQQGGVCAICNRPETATFKTGTIKHLSVDHDHTTGKVRALLCAECNSGLGKFAENIDRMAHAMAYISQHKKQTA